MTEQQTSSDTADMMASANTITVMICKGFSGEIVRTTIVPSDIVGEALPIIADAIHYYSPDFEQIGIYNLTGDFEYQLDDRFDERGTRDGDLLVMADGGVCHK